MPRLRKKKTLSQYQLRDKTLKRLGYDSYAKYLRSDLWESLRYEIWERDDGKCQGCGKRGHSTHHRNYREATLKGEDLSGLILLCRGCHRKIEFRGKRKVMCGKAVERRLEKLLKKE